MIVVNVMTRPAVEAEAEQVLADYVRMCGSPLTLPIDVDLVGEALFELRYDWDTIEEPLDKLSHAENLPETLRRDLIILAGLYPRSRRVVLNEKHVEIFENRPGLERFTKGHEIGHWVLHIDKAALAAPTLALFDADESDPRETIICRDGDDTWIERQADWFSAALLMPRQLFQDEAVQHSLDNWANLYALADRFGVTISALTNRLRQFNLAHVDADRRIHRTVAEANGQMRLRH